MQTILYRMSRQQGPTVINHYGKECEKRMYMMYSCITLLCSGN